MNADLTKILSAFPDSRADARVKSFIGTNGITDVETLLRLRAADVRNQFGFGEGMVGALEKALEKGGFRFAMLFAHPA